MLHMTSADSDEREQSPHGEPTASEKTWRLSFANLDPTEFEEFCLDLLIAAGYVNVDWRKGTPKRASPADSGRDLVAQLERVDADGHKHFETWFVDCKHYDKAVPPAALGGLMTWAEAERPDAVLIMTTSYLSNPAKDWLASYERNNNPRFRIRHWEKPTIERVLRQHPDLIVKHDIFPEFMRTTAEILAAEHEFFEKVWYGRSRIFDDPAGVQARKRVEDTYGADSLGPWDDFGWGFLSGKLSALRWVLGDDWDFLDT
jgi:hypothetical protein